VLAAWSKESHGVADWYRFIGIFECGISCSSHVIISTKYSSRADPSNACMNTVRSARLDAEEEEEHSLTQATRLTPTGWTHASIFTGRT